MAEPEVDPLVFILWMMWFYPGLIAFTSILVYLQTQAFKEATTSASANPEISGTLNGTRVSAGGQDTGIPRIVHHELDHAFEAEKNPEPKTPRRDMELIPMTPAKPAQMSPKEHMRLVMVWQTLQLIVLERMGHAAAKEHTQSKDPIIFSAGLLAMCTFAVTMSLGHVQKAWSTARPSTLVAGRIESGSKFVKLAMILAVIPWVELMAARYWNLTD